MANPESAAEPPAIKLPLLPMLVLALVSVLLALGGSAAVVLFLAKAGKLGGVATSTSAAHEVSEVPTHAVALEPLLANLADSDGHSFLRLGIVLQVEDSPAKKGEKEAKGPSAADASLRDTVLEVLGRKRSEELMAQDGKESLKKELKQKFADQNPLVKVREIYFTDFLVQR